MKTMKTIFSTFILLFSLVSFSQEVFEYEFDENLTINVLDNSEEGEISNGKFIKGTYGNETIVYLKSKKEGLKNLSEKELIRLYDGIKDGTIKSSNGKLISEKIIKLQNLETLNYKFSMVLEGVEKIIENFAFLYKENVYTIQFMNTKDEFESNNEFRQNIIESIKLN